MMLYKIIFVLFCFGFVSTGINASGLFPMVVPEPGYNNVTEAQVTEMTEQASGELSPLFILSFLIWFVKAILGGLLAILTIIPLLLAWGCPLWVAGMVQGPIWIVSLYGVFTTITGTRLED